MALALGAFAIGAVQVSTAAHAEVLRTSAGLLVAATATGGVVASFLYGGLTLPGTLPTHLVASLALYGVLILTLLSSRGLLVSMMLLFLIGAATGPADAIEAMLVGRHTPVAAQAQAFAVLVTSNWIGFGLGSAVGGALIENVTVGTGIVAAGTGALAAAALILVPALHTNRGS